MQKTFADHVINFYHDLNGPEVPHGVEVLQPYQNEQVQLVAKEFYQKFYADRQERTFLIGINPGRFGGGATGIPFTDPIRLAAVCDIPNDFDKKAELSSKFIYEVIAAYGGVSAFYSDFYFTSVSPLGFVKDGKNLNYYDIKELQDGWEDFMVTTMKEQLAFGGDTKVAYSLGMGKNIKYLNYLNKKYTLFDKIVPLPHPRWVMQYRLKHLETFVDEYVTKLRNG